MICGPVQDDVEVAVEAALDVVGPARAAVGLVRDRHETHLVDRLKVSLSMGLGLDRSDPSTRVDRSEISTRPGQNDNLNAESRGEGGLTWGNGRVK